MRSLLLTVGTASLAAAALPLLSADHREAPTISEIPPADINDVYVFRNPNQPSRLVLVMTVNPLAVPEFATTYAFSPNVLYRFTVDTTGDGVPERNIDVTFSPLSSGGQTFTANFPTGIVVEGEATRPTLQTTEPNPPEVARGPEGSGIRVFAGPRDDPFFFDFVGFNRFVATDPPELDAFTGVDSFAGLNVSAIVVEVPLALVSDGQDQLQIGGVTYPLLDVPEFSDPEQLSERVRPLDRMGNPAVSTALIPSELKDEFNRLPPENDAENFAGVIVDRLQNFYGTSPENIQIAASVGVPDLLRFDPSQPDGYPNGRELQNDVVDTLLRLFLNLAPFGEDDVESIDGVNSNDRPFLNSFPYLAPPHQELPPSDDELL